MTDEVIALGSEATTPTTPEVSTEDAAENNQAPEPKAKPSKPTRVRVTAATDTAAAVAIMANVARKTALRQKISRSFSNADQQEILNTLLDMAFDGLVPPDDNV